MKSGHYATELGGRSIAVEVADAWLTTTAVLYVEDEQVSRGSADLETVLLEHDDVRVRVKSRLSGAVARCELILTDEPDGDDDPVEHYVPLDPPPGTRAARLAEFQRERPRLYAARHVAIAAGQILIAVVGVGALLRGLLPRLDLSWLPDLDMSWVPDVNLSWIPDPLGWLWSRLPDISIPGWLDPVLETSKYWVPILVAIGIALNEVDKRRKANDAKREADKS